MIKNSKTIVSFILSGALIFSVHAGAFAGETGEAAIELSPRVISDYSVDDTDTGIDEVKDYTIDAKYQQTAGRECARITNTFRTSNTWMWDEHGNKKNVSGLSPLTYDYGLEKIATLRAVEIAFMFAHQRPNMEACFSAYDELYPGVDFGSMGENIAYGYPTADDVFTAWKEENEDYNGQGHRRNMLESSFNYIGIGHVIIDNTHYWVQEFSGKPVDSTDPGAIDDTRSVTVKVEESEIGNTITIPGNASEGGNASLIGNVPMIYGAKVDISSIFSKYMTGKYKFSSSDKKIAKVNKKGVVTGGKKAGEAKISLKIKNGKSWTTVGIVLVKNRVPKITKKTEISVGSTISANDLCSDKDDLPLSWETNKSNIIRVEKDGTVTGLKSGSAKLYPVYSAGKGKVYAKIKVH